MKPKKILIIEDEDGLREIIQLTLETVAGWEVVAVTSGSEGLAQAKANRPDAILLDVMMPNMDGIETFQRLQSTAETQDIPTIFLTAKARSAEHQQFVNLGILGVITKPIKALDLVQQIRKILKWSE
jgi:CheY-like chemotaxis protein